MLLCLRLLQFAKASLLDGFRILELGAGTGTLGILLAMHGAMVDVTDLPVCCELLQWNIDANRTAFSEREEKPLRVRAVGLDWTQPLPAELRQQQQEAEEDLRYDFVVASDVLYMPRLHEPFFRTLSQITTEGTTVVLGYEAYAEEFEETEFYGMLRGIFICEAVPLPKEVSRGCDVFLLQRVKQDLQGQEAEGSVTA